MIRGINIGLIFILFLTLLNSCEKERISSSSEEALRFSTSVINFDTLSSPGSNIQNLRIRNYSNDQVLVSSIRLAGGKQSRFKLNINGEAANESANIRIPANDSIFIFVEALPGKGSKDVPTIREDSIVVSYNTTEQKIKLLAWESDFNLVKSASIKTTTWNSDKPYLVYNYAYVDSGQVLTLEPGTRIFFHNSAGLFVKGTLIVKGTAEDPVEFRGDRIRKAGNDNINPWNGIVLYSGSHNNKIDHAIIRDANIGLQVGTIEHSGFASLTISNSRIENMNWSGIWAMKSKIVAYNNVISNVKYYNTALLLGGDYQFYQNTFANYYNDPTSTPRSTETLFISNYLVDNSTGKKYVGDMKSAVFGNCIVTGNRLNELAISMDKRGSANYFFDRCLIQVSDSFKTGDPVHFKEIIRNINPRFKNPYKGNFELDTLSLAKDFGRSAYGRLYPFDVKENSRMLDAAPDLGAFERTEKKGLK
jgi:hypothetical protein